MPYLLSNEPDPYFLTRIFLESVVDEFWLVNDGKVGPFKGDLKDYQKWLNENRWGKEKKMVA